MAAGGTPGLVAAAALAAVAMTTILLALLVERQPRRWIVFYALFFLASLATTVGLAVGGLDWEVTSQLLGLMAGLGLVWACLGDGFTPRVRRAVSATVTALSVAGGSWVVLSAVGAQSGPVGSLEGVRLATAVFLAQVTIAGVLMTVGYLQMPAKAVPLLPPLGIAAVVAAGLWVLPEEMLIGELAAHDLAMLVAGTCLLLLWGLNQLRFNRRDFIVVEVAR
ncbi:MAG TPA: hypothetical protein VID03_05445 [Acidimicrobiia bacterium]